MTRPFKAVSTGLPESFLGCAGVTGNEAAELAQVLDRLQVAEEEAADSPDDVSIQAVVPFDFK